MTITQLNLLRMSLPTRSMMPMLEAAGLSKENTIVTYCTAGIRSAYMQLIL